MAQTKLTNLINAEVFADAVSAKLGDAIKLYQMAFVQNFEGEQSGSINVPKYAYIGDAELLAEGMPVDPTLLSQTADVLTVGKVAKAVQITDEAAKGSFGNPIGQAEEQLTKSIANGIEKEMFESLADATLSYVGGQTALNGSAVFEALNLFGEDQDGVKFLIVHPTQLANLKQDPNYVNGQFIDMDVVSSNRVPVKSAYIMKPEAVGLYLSKDVDVETARDTLAFQTVISASSHFATHLRDASKVVKITLV